MLFIDDAHQLDPDSEKPARQVLYRLTLTLTLTRQ